jgi:hypothetical protein
MAAAHSALSTQHRWAAWLVAVRAKQRWWRASWRATKATAAEENTDSREPAERTQPNCFLEGVYAWGVGFEGRRQPVCRTMRPSWPHPPLALRNTLALLTAIGSIVTRGRASVPAPSVESTSHSQGSSLGGCAACPRAAQRPQHHL